MRWERARLHQPKQRECAVEHAYLAAAADDRNRVPADAGAFEAIALIASSAPLREHNRAIGERGSRFGTDQTGNASAEFLSGSIKRR